MFRIDTSDAVAIKPAKPAAGSPKWYQDTDPTGGTLVPAWWLNMMQDEILAVLTAGSITPSKTNDGQLLLAINALIAAGGGSSNVFAYVDFTIAGAISGTPLNVTSVSDDGTDLKTITFTSNASNTDYMVHITQRDGSPIAFNPNVIVKSRAVGSFTIFHDSEINTEGYLVSVIGG